MIIEFFGPLGSGKSCLARKLVEDKQYKLCDTKNNLEKYLFSTIYFLLNPFKTISLIKKCLGRSFVLRKLALLNYTMAKYQKARLNRKGKSVMEEGFLQSIFSIIDYPSNKKEIMSYLKNIPLPKLIIYIDVSEKIRQKRARQRGYDNPEKMFGKKYSEKWIESMEKNDLILKDLLKKFPEIIIIKNDQTLEKSVKQLKSKIKKQLNLFCYD
jgi:thymidylate kinase